MRDSTMAVMEMQIARFCAEFSVPPHEAIPALYDAIAAGVSPDILFVTLEASRLACPKTTQDARGDA